MNLKTKSHGKNEQRQLVVYKVWTLYEILENLLRCGGESEKYSLRYPQGAGSSNSSTSSNRVVVDKENPNVSVRILPRDSTKATASLLTSESKNERQNVSQRQGVTVKKSSVLRPGSVNKEPASVNVPEIVFLSSDDDTDSQNKLQDYGNYRRDIADKAEEILKGCDIIYESDIELINRVINKKKEEITTLQTGFEELLDIYNKNNCFTPKQKKKYIISRNILQNLTGTFILNVLQPEWTIEAWKCGKIPKNGSLNNFNMRCVAAGMAEVENNIELKQKILFSVKRKLLAYKLIENKQTTRAIKRECCMIGSKLVSDSLYVKKSKPEKKPNELECRRMIGSELVSDSLYVKKSKPEKKPNKYRGGKRKSAQKAMRNPKFKNRVWLKSNPPRRINFDEESERLKSKGPINFVKASGNQEDDLSGVEYSDEEFDLSD